MAKVSNGVKVPFRVFAHGLDLPTWNAFRVKLGLKHSELETQFDEGELAASLAELQGKPVPVAASAPAPAPAPSVDTK